MSDYLLPLCYLGPISYYYYRVNYESAVEIHAHYERRSYANRAIICSSQGEICLTAPIEKCVGKCAIKDIRLCNRTDWQTLHWRAIESAYNSSPFFEYYRDELEKIYKKRFDFLLDLNVELEDWALSALDFSEINKRYTESYIDNIKNDEFDLRNKIEPKKKGLYLHNKLKVPYYQVFDQRHGFQSDLSIIDLIFNMGNESRIYLKNKE